MRTKVSMLLTGIAVAFRSIAARLDAAAVWLSRPVRAHPVREDHLAVSDADTGGVQRWLDQLTAGALGISARPAPSTEWHAAYRSWCHREGVMSVSCQAFVHALAGMGVRTARKRYTVCGSTLGPHGFLIFGA